MTYPRAFLWAACLVALVLMTSAIGGAIGVTCAVAALFPERFQHGR